MPVPHRSEKKFCLISNWNLNRRPGHPRLLTHAGLRPSRSLHHYFPLCLQRHTVYFHSQHLSFIPQRAMGEEECSQILATSKTPKPFLSGATVPQCIKHKQIQQERKSKSVLVEKSSGKDFSHVGSPGQPDTVIVNSAVCMCVHV